MTGFTRQGPGLWVEWQRPVGPRRKNDRVINAERILTALDRRLDHEVSLVIYGRVAIALGFENPPARGR